MIFKTRKQIQEWLKNKEIPKFSKVLDKTEEEEFITIIGYNWKYDHERHEAGLIGCNFSS